MRPVLASQDYTTGTAKEVRLQSKVPAAIYGLGRETQNIAVDKQDFKRVLRKAGKSTLIEVEVGKEKVPSLIHVVDMHPVSGEPVHIDFHAVNMNKEVQASVPVQVKGTSDAVKLLGGILTVMHNSVKIKCLPKDLISQIDGDLSKLKTFHDSLTVSDLPFPDSITVLDDPETVIASVNAPRLATEAEEEDEAAEGEATGEAAEKKEE
jgi:large subunit ribosomal protein L25